MTSAPRTDQADVTVGLVGVDSFVHRVIDLARSLDHPGLRLLPASYADEGAIRSVVTKVAGQCDSLLFAGPFPYDRAVAGGELDTPCVVVPTGGPAVHAALVQALHAGHMDPLRLSIDSVTEADLAEAYDEVGLDASATHVLPYAASLSSRDFVDFHADLHADGRSSGAISTVPSVVEALHGLGVPVVRMLPATLTVRQALTNAILAGSGSKFEETRLAVLLVRLPQRTLPGSADPGQYWFSELRLSLHRELLVQARRLDAIVMDAAPRGFLLLTTVGALRSLTDDLTTAAFAGQIADAIGVQAEVGIGLGDSALEATGNAYTAADETHDPAAEAVISGPDGLRLRLPTRGGSVVRADDTRNARDVATLHTLISRLHADGESRYVVDAERAAALLDVTLRTARRTLQGLVEAGLAWPLPPARTKKVGRPPMSFQLVERRAEPNGASPAGPADLAGHSAEGDR